MAAAQRPDRAGELLEPHRRYDPLADRWVLVSAERLKRPWQGAAEQPATTAAPTYDPTCYLCPGNERANGARNPEYTETFVFTNDFAALRPDVEPSEIEDGLLRAASTPGTCRVLCFSPRHDLTLASMEDGAVRRVVDLWADQTAELGRSYRWVQVFENRGAAMGASNPHPHGQVWAIDALPGEAARELVTQATHLERTGRRLLLDVLEQESDGPRVVTWNADWAVLVPYWAAWPYETLVVARRPVGRLQDLDDGERNGLVAVLRTLLDAYDALFGVPFPYSMGWHQAPFDAAAGSGTRDADAWQLHAHFYPPLLDATRRKFMVGYELLSETQRDIRPESAAAALRDAAARSEGSNDRI